MYSLGGGESPHCSTHRAAQCVPKYTCQLYYLVLLYKKIIFVYQMCLAAGIKVQPSLTTAGADPGEGAPGARPP